MLRRSRVGAELNADAVPCSAVLQAQPAAWRRTCTLAGGDDYELVFTAPPHRAGAVAAAARSVSVDVARIGRIEAAAGLRLVDAQGHPVAPTFGSFDHFKA